MSGLSAQEMSCLLSDCKHIKTLVKLIDESDLPQMRKEGLYYWLFASDMAADAYIALNQVEDNDIEDWVGYEEALNIINKYMNFKKECSKEYKKYVDERFNI